MTGDPRREGDRGGTPASSIVTIAPSQRSSNGPVPEVHVSQIAFTLVLPEARLSGTAPITLARPGADADVFPHDGYAAIVLAVCLEQRGSPLPVNEPVPG